jgi:1,5-anhydro-D-fructose reductase (1,5-anhydro-D-mannitol-forming)
MRWGLIGASSIAEGHVIAALRANGGEVAAVVSSTLDRAKDFSLRNDIANAGAELAVVLDDPTIDAVYISSTNEKHHDQALAAIAAGKHVLCEKPLAMSVADAAEMVLAAERAGRVFATNHHLRCAGSHRAVKGLISGGRIGRVLSLRLFHAVHLPESLRGWRINDAGAGGGVIPDITVHDADVARFLLGEDPVSHPFAGSGLEVHGTEGSIFARGVMTQAPVGEIDLVTASGRESVAFARHDLYGQGVQDFLSAVTGLGHPAASGWDGVASLAVALAVREAARTGIRQDVVDARIA